ncbi:hypothetical protein [Leptolyngbya sp. 'hensonii']|uniref:hypothetical protein n=1 Tax=Leptolyngbya sp. 'hensonii' TaxID=1922337 RepID=UPI000B228B52|nr:hypothetical protein [Leptolyngbya sp. 'hensonii']
MPSSSVAASGSQPEFGNQGPLPKQTRLCLGAHAVIIQRRSIWFPARLWEPGTHQPLPRGKFSPLLAPRLCLGA